MLERLFHSKTRIKLLRLFLTNESESYGLKDIVKKTGLGLGIMKKELDNLEKLRLIVEGKNKILLPEKAEKKISLQKKKKKNIKAKFKIKTVYSLNKNFVLYPELRSLIIKSQLLLEEILVKKIKQLGTIYYLVLTGFFTNTPSAKTDLLIVGRINRKKLKSIINKIEKDLGRDVRFTTMSLQEFKYRSDLTDRFLFDILEGKKVVLIGNLPN